MMASPNYYVKMHKNDSYEELIRERDSLIRKIRKFETDEKNGDRTGDGWKICPSPQVIYQCNLEYLAELCKYMQERYNEQLWAEQEEKYKGNGYNEKGDNND